MSESKNNLFWQLLVGLFGVLCIGFGGTFFPAAIYLIIWNASGGSPFAGFVASEYYLSSVTEFFLGFLSIGFGLFLLIWSRLR